MDASQLIDLSGRSDGERARRDAAVGRLLDDMAALKPIEHGFRQIFALYYRPLVQFFKNRGFDTEDCLDLTQETFLGIYSGIGSFRREAGFETWLFKIATNAFRKRLRSRAAEKRTGEEISLDEPGQGEDRRSDLPSAAPLPSEELLRREQAEMVRHAVGGLPSQMRQCLILRLDRELKYREIAETMRLSSETVKAHLYQARARLRQELAGVAQAELDDLVDKGRS